MRPVIPKSPSIGRPTADLGAEKGESIAGYQAGYANGRYGRGAPANGGGGGNAHNSGGGGGANAASGLTWTGQGVMTGCTPATPGPWELDDAYTSNPAADKCSKSEGGGRGGYSFSYADQDPTAVAPGVCTGGTSWAGNCRQQVGGWGGRPVVNSVGGANPRLFMGGGGGAGDGDNTYAGPGGNGGGLVFLIAGSVAGPATAGIVASGAAGGGATVTGNNWNDAAGGGGGGGTIVVSAATIGDISITASGGPGGNQSGGRTDEAEGPGGGGGGGYVAVAGTSTATIAAAGGLAGTTNQAVMTDFDRNGATAGNAGVTNGSAAGFLYCGFQLTTIATHPDAITSSTIGIFTFTNPVAGVTYECRLDGGAWGVCNGVDGGTGGGYTAVGLADGSHTFEVRATDPDDNVENPPATFTWTVDTAAPNTTIATKPGATSGDRTADFTFESSETPATFECALDGATTWTACTATYTTPQLTDGDHTLAVRAKDAAGNVDGTPATHAWNVNTGYPFTTIATHPNAASNDPTGDFTFTNTRDPVTYECRLDTAATWTACGPSYTTPSLGDGSHTLRVRATASALDGGVFVEDPPVIFTWTVDSVPPDTSITSNPPGLSQSPTATFTFESTESPVTYECKIDGGDWAACTATFTTAPLPNGIHTLSVRSKDAAGNVDATPATSTWEIAAMVIDGGAIDGGGRDVPVGPGIDGAPPIIDGGRVDVGAIDGGRLDGQRLDGAVVDGGVRDVAADVAAGPDTRPVRPRAWPGHGAGADRAGPRCRGQSGRARGQRGRGRHAAQHQGAGWRILRRHPGAHQLAGGVLGAGPGRPGAPPPQAGLALRPDAWRPGAVEDLHVLARVADAAVGGPVGGEGVGHRSGEHVAGELGPHAGVAGEGTGSRRPGHGSADREIEGSRPTPCP